MISIEGMPFDDVVRRLTKELKRAPLVDVGEWQAIRKSIPQTKTREVENVAFEWRMPSTISGLQQQTKPNLPWAEDHFLERVSGIPYNPPPSHEYWPFAQKSNDEHRKEAKFSHTYPERFWPRYDSNGDRTEHYGIRYRYGDLADLVHLLQRSPYTRQAYLPVWYPEDTGAVHGERVPCTLGYHFLLRGDRLSCRYFIRSCDFLRHFRDDVYMAARLTQWIADQTHSTPGNLLMVIGSLHIFDGEQDVLQVEEREWEGMFT